MITFRMNRGAVHIAFHYVFARIDILKKTIGFIQTWGVYVDIFIHSNVTECITGLNATWIYHKDLDHPFALTWLPIETIKTQIDKYDFFVYIEDDIGIPNSAFEYWKRYPIIHTGFIRKNIITEQYDDIVSAGYTIENAFSETNDPSFIIFKGGSLYKAFWINTNDQMKYYLSIFEETTMYDIRRNLEWSRERSAFGNSALVSSLFPIKEINNSIIWHLAKAS